jgi:TatD DNase family protein
MQNVQLFDAHCHLQLPLLYGVVDDVVNTALKKGVQHIACNGCTQKDWAQVEEIASKFKDVVLPQFGVHPWYV